MVLMDLHLIGVLKDFRLESLKKETKGISGFRVCSKQVDQITHKEKWSYKDVSADQLKAVLLAKRARVVEMDYDPTKDHPDCWVGLNGSIDRYTSIYGHSTRGNTSVVILEQIGNTDYIVSDWRCNVITIKQEDFVRLLSNSNYSLANGKLVTKNGVSFISAISGSYITRQLPVTPVAQNTQNQNITSSNNNNPADFNKKSAELNGGRIFSKGDTKSVTAKDIVRRAAKFQEAKEDLEAAKSDILKQRELELEIARAKITRAQHKAGEDTSGKKIYTDEELAELQKRAEEHLARLAEQNRERSYPLLIPNQASVDLINSKKASLRGYEQAIKALQLTQEQVDRVTVFEKMALGLKHVRAYSIYRWAALNVLDIVPCQSTKRYDGGINTKDGGIISREDVKGVLSGEKDVNTVDVHTGKVSKSERKKSSYVQDVDTLAVSITKFYYNIDFVADIDVPSLIFILLHEASHVIMKHNARLRGRIPTLWNTATDLFINKLLAEELNATPSSGPVLVRIQDRGSDGSGYGRSSIGFYVSFPDCGLYSDKIDTKTMTPELIYEDLYKDVEEELNKQGKSMVGDDNSQSGQQSQQNQQGQGQGQSGQQSGQQQNQQGQQGQGQSGQQPGQQQGQGQSGQGQSGQPGQQSQQGQGQGQGQSQNQQGQGQSQGGQGQNQNSGGQGGQGGQSGSGDVMRKATPEDIAKVLSDMFGVPVSPASGDLVDDKESKNMTQGEKEQKSSDAVKRLAAVAKTYSKSGHCDDYYEQLIEVQEAPKINWKAILRSKLNELSKKDTSLSHPHRRYISRGLYVPGQVEGDKDKINRVLIGIDCSGSISSTEIGIALGHIKNICRAYKTTGQIVFWDTEVSKELEFDDIDEALKARPTSSGGTDPDCLFEYANKIKFKGRKKKPAAIIVITDGCFYGSDLVKHKKWGRDTLWVLTDKRSEREFNPPFGKVAPLDPED